MKIYMALDGLRWSRDSGSANCDIPRSAVFGRSGGVNLVIIIFISSILILLLFGISRFKILYRPLAFIK